jgi:hypothetical protein
MLISVKEGHLDALYMAAVSCRWENMKLLSKHGYESIRREWFYHGVVKGLSAGAVMTDLHAQEA